MHGMTVQNAVLFTKLVLHPYTQCLKFNPKKVSFIFPNKEKINKKF